MARDQADRKVADRGLAPWQRQVAVRILLHDLGADFPVARVAGMCGLSRSYFTKAFRVSMGLPPHRWLVRQRLLRAEAMLEGTDQSISRIAVSCGFADQSHLTRIFRATLGASPAAWRRRRHAGASAGTGSLMGGSVTEKSGLNSGL